ncbi:MAG: CidA/LrgA family protein [Acidibrevibacterium sp.]|uniref:CidA/LrgA family protein n=1 Tax=Acidibrevibacterium sp. TaxID=2606776 RepID=UPI003D017BBD
MVQGVTVLLICQFIGEVLTRALALPVPGPVLGMLILLAGLALGGRAGKSAPEVKRAAEGLLSHLGLLFVPAGVGVITELDVLGANWLAVVLTLFGSTMAGLIVTGVVMQRLARPDA